MKQEILSSLVYGGCTALVIVIVAWARRREASRPVPPVMSKETQDQMIRTCLATVRKEFADRILIVGAEFIRSRGVTAPALAIWYIVDDSSTEKAVRDSELYGKIDACTREHLGVSGYLRQTGGSVTVYVSTHESFLASFESRL